ncbi:MAG: FAD-dependent oxidoreductase [Pseudomonadota bacterium]
MAKSKKTPDDFDVAVIGAGPTGGALALLCAMHGFETALVDARDPRRSPAADGRNFAIVRGSWRLLDAVGLSESLAGSQPLNGLEAEDGGAHIFGAPYSAFLPPTSMMLRAARHWVTWSKQTPSNQR